MIKWNTQKGISFKLLFNFLGRVKYFSYLQQNSTILITQEKKSRPKSFKIYRDKKFVFHEFREDVKDL